MPGVSGDIVFVLPQSHIFLEVKFPLGYAARSVGHRAEKRKWGQDSKQKELRLGKNSFL